MTLTILPADNINIFLKHLNSIYDNVKLTIELQVNNSLAFLDDLVIKNLNGTVGHKMYRKPTHTKRYLNGESHHYPTQLSTVGREERAHHLCDSEHPVEAPSTGERCPS